MLLSQGWLMEDAMTSEIGVEHVEGQLLAFHCSCGAFIQTRERKKTCPDCGETVEVVRCVSKPRGNKYTLRISKHRNGWSKRTTALASRLHRRDNASHAASPARASQQCVS
jgi:predicted RNA-binding Zn-ribbon protein involved in translation (DUF1610 family)